ncbi:putative transposase [Streptomyces bingchenggensis BCW-1]|uniref:Putative transposase n=1 Tax=Streptomyces bingchenggensis (strain BCW-1) TaxID=749414 RepID=D7C5U0_STRBB|nr:putative transposase [Streptomyces bingchenggensis BCW-1]
MESDRWTAFRSHWCIEAFYCRPGIEGAHEEGGVEGQIGYFCRNHFAPVLEAASLAELNELVDRWDLADEGRRLRSRTRTIGKYFAREHGLLKPLPGEVFETGRWFTPQVNRYSQISVRSNIYSVRCGHRPTVAGAAARRRPGGLRRPHRGHYERQAGRGGSRLVLDHYLEALLRKPDAFSGSTPLEAARSGRRFPRPRQVVDSGAGRARRGSRHPRADRGAAASTAHGARTRRRRARRRLPGGRADRGRGRGRAGGPARPPRARPPRCCRLPGLLRVRPTGPRRR